MIVIGADTVVALDGKILGKTKSKEDAFTMIQSLQGRAHQVYTGTAILIFDEFGNCRTVNHAVRTEVFVNPMSEEEITDYIEHENVMDKAGAYGIQGRFAIHIDKIEGDYYNVVGLPISYIYEVLKKEENDEKPNGIQTGISTFDVYGSAANGVDADPVYVQYCGQHICCEIG